MTVKIVSNSIWPKSYISFNWIVKDKYFWNPDDKFEGIMQTDGYFLIRR